MGELVNRPLVVKDGDALAAKLSELQFLEVERKNRKSGRHIWRIIVTRDIKNVLDRIKHFLEGDTIAVIVIPSERNNDSPHRIMFSNDWSPLKGMSKLPTFDAVRKYLNVLEEHVDLEFDYEAERRKAYLSAVIGLASFGILIPFIYLLSLIGATIDETLPIINILLFGVVSALAVVAFFFLAANLEVFFGLEKGRWWIPATYIKRARKNDRI